MYRRAIPVTSQLCMDLLSTPLLVHYACRLEEAEAAMQAQRLQHERANPRLAKAVARDEGKQLGGLAVATAASCGCLC